MLVVATCRSEERHRVSIAGLDSPSVDRILLDRLDEDAVGAIVGDMLALAAPPPVFSRFLYRHSEGNPFFVAEYLRAAVESGLLWRDPEAGWHVGEPGGGSYRPHVLLFDTFVPALRARGLDDAAVRRLLVENPAHAFGIRRRPLAARRDAGRAQLSGSPSTTRPTSGGSER